MAELAVAIISFIAEICFHVIVLAARPAKYLLSKSYKEKVNIELAGRSSLVLYSYIFGGFFAILAAVFVVIFWSIIIFGAHEPTTSERFKLKVKEVLSESIHKA